MTVDNLKFANTLRRIVFSELCSYACESVVIQRNSTILTDEMIAFNLAWAPLKTIQEEMSSGTVVENALSLDCTNATNSVRVLRLGDLNNHRQDLFEFLDPDVVVAAVQPGQNLQFTVDVMFSSGVTHSKFCPAKKVALCTNGGLKRMKITAQKGINAGHIGRDALRCLEAQLSHTLSNINVAT